MLHFSLVTLSTLRLIRDTAQLRSISKAARANELSQSAASQAIQELERELQLELFDRTRRPLEVTRAGKLYVDYCRDVLRRADELQADLEALNESVAGTVRMASIYSVGLVEVSDIEARFRAEYPDAELRVSYLRPEKVWEAVGQDQADIGLMSYAESSRDIVALPWRNEEMVVAASSAHPLAAKRSVRPADLAGQAFVGFDEELPIQQRIERYLREHRTSVDIVLRYDNIENIKHAVAHDAGLSIMPRRVLKEDVDGGRLTALPLDPPDLYRPVRIVHRRRKVMNRATLGLLGLLQQDADLR